MDKITLRRLRPSSFTLVEMLTVIAIMGILTAIVLWAGAPLVHTSMRGRTQGEIKNIASALENYKTENGTYPTNNNLYGPQSFAYNSSDPSVASGSYQASSEYLYQSLSGKTNYYDSAGRNKCYYVFSGNQVGNPSGTNSGTTYIQDPFGFSYGYSTGDGTTNGNVPYSGFGMFDLWSTGGGTTKPQTNVWITNWK